LDRRRFFGIAGAVGASIGLAVGSRRAASAEPVVRIAVLKFGTVSWTLAAIDRHGLDGAEGVRVELLELASNQATLVALQAGRVDIAVSDWLWVSRQRAGGADWTFVPYSTALGALIVPNGSPIRRLEELEGKRLGVAGTPLDKSWLLLRLLSIRRTGRDLDAAAERSFGAPPLLSEQLAAGRLDALLTYWPFAARLEARGARQLLGMDEVLHELGVERPVPMVGYVMSERWVRENEAALDGFLRAERKAATILAASDDEWRAIAPLTGAADPAELERLRDDFRAGIPRRWGAAERADAERLYALLASIGGEALVGSSRSLSPGTFLDGVRY
jgi:NitT/TauT family transport system substrate-binding protein